MGQREKLIERIRRRPPEAHIADIERLLAFFGWQRARQTGSHVVFSKEGTRSITIPLAGSRKVKRLYLDLICRELDLDALDTTPDPTED